MPVYAGGNKKKNRFPICALKRFTKYTFNAWVYKSILSPKSWAPGGTRVAKGLPPIPIRIAARVSLIGKF